MDLNLLSLFVEVADAGSLSAAGRRMGVSRSHVSQRLQLLEHTLGTQLVRRTTRRLALTQAGEDVYEHGLRIREAAAAARAVVPTAAQALTGTLKVSVPIGFGRLVVAPLLLEFGRRHPGVTLVVRFSNRLEEMVAEEIDVAVRVLPAAPKGFDAAWLGPIAWRLCASADYGRAHGLPDRAAQLAGHAVVWPPTGSGRVVLRMRERGRAVALSVRPRIQSVDLSFLLEAVLAGLGIGLLPSYLVAEGLADGRLVPVLPEVKVANAGERLYLLTARSDVPLPAQRHLVQFLTAALPARLAETA